MTWSCRACTSDNTEEEYLCCFICGAVRCEDVIDISEEEIPFTTSSASSTSQILSTYIAHESIITISDVSDDDESTVISSTRRNILSHEEEEEQEEEDDNFNVELNNAVGVNDLSLTQILIQQQSDQELALRLQAEEKASHRHDSVSCASDASVAKLLQEQLDEDSVERKRSEIENDVSSLLDVLKSHRTDIRDCDFLKKNFKNIGQIDEVADNPYSKPGQPLYNNFVTQWERVPNQTIKCVFHGTPEGNIDNICRTGLDYKRRSGQAYGPGEYFATDATTAHAYCRGGRKMLVFAVLMDPSGIRNQVNTILVVKKGNHQLPLFVVTFSNKQYQQPRQYHHVPNAFHMPVSGFSVTNALIPSSNNFAPIATQYHQPQAPFATRMAPPLPPPVVQRSKSSKYSKKRTRAVLPPMLPLPGSADAKIPTETLHFQYSDIIDWSVASGWSRKYALDGRYGAGEEGGSEEDLFGEVYGNGVANAVVQLPCGHVFRQNSIEKWFNQKPCCPSCQGEGKMNSNSMLLTVGGAQPSGTMHVKWEGQDCSGSAGVGSIAISYSFPSGIQGRRMERPGVTFTGTMRQCYYPHTAEGIQMLRLLKKAFMAGALFIVGRSVTTKQDNVVVWGGIHQKTSRQGGAASHGWPDEQRLSILTDECKQRGIELQQESASPSSSSSYHTNTGVNIKSNCEKTSQSTKNKKLRPGSRP